jgi:hypothetical protein
VLAGLELFLALWLLTAVVGALAVRAQRTPFDAHLVPVPPETLREGERLREVLDEAEALGLRPEGAWELVRSGKTASKKHDYLAAFLTEDGRSELLVGVVRPSAARALLPREPVVWAFHSRGERRCMTFGSADGVPVRTSPMYPRDPAVLARAANVTSVRELREAHERHVADIAFDARPVEAAGAPARILETNQANLERLIASGHLERVGDDFRPAWTAAARNVALAVLVPIGLDPRPARAAIALALIATAGGVAAHAAPAALAGLDANQAELALAGLFALLAAATSGLVRRSQFAWGFACVPAAIVLRDDRCPFAWIAALVAMALVVVARRRLR